MNFEKIYKSAGLFTKRQIKIDPLRIKFHSGGKYQNNLHDKIFARRIFYFTNTNSELSIDLDDAVKSQLKKTNGLIFWDKYDFRFFIRGIYYRLRFGRDIYNEGMRAQYRQVLCHTQFFKFTDSLSNLENLLSDFYALPTHLSQKNYWSNFSQASHVIAVEKIEQKHFNRTSSKEKTAIIFNNLVKYFYEDSSTLSSQDLANALMKVFSVTTIKSEQKIKLYRSKLLNFDIRTFPFRDACEVLNYTYTLTKIMNNASEKEKQHCENILIGIAKNLAKMQNTDGGFRFHFIKLHYTYLGTKRKNTNQYELSDLHGTSMCVWALKICDQFLNHKKFNFEH